MNILFVCTGNTCRSPMAAAIMNKIAEDRDLDVRIESAGIYALYGMNASENAVKALDKMGIDLTCHISKPITEELISQSDLILTMTEGHKKALGDAAKGKAYTLLEYAGKEGNIPDPYGGSVDEYMKCANVIFGALDVIGDKLK